MTAGVNGVRFGAPRVGVPIEKDSVWMQGAAVAAGAVKTRFAVALPRSADLTGRTVNGFLRHLHVILFLAGAALLHIACDVGREQSLPDVQVLPHVICQHAAVVPPLLPCAANCAPKLGECADSNLVVHLDSTGHPTLAYIEGHRSPESDACALSEVLRWAQEERASFEPARDCSGRPLSDVLVQGCGMICDPMVWPDVVERSTAS